MKKPLVGCVLCRDCKHKLPPHSVGVLTIKDLTFLGYSGCKLDNDNRLSEADRKCQSYEGNPFDSSP